MKLKPKILLGVLLVSIFQFQTCSSEYPTCNKRDFLVRIVRQPEPTPGPSKPIIQNALRQTTSQNPPIVRPPKTKKPKPSAGAAQIKRNNEGLYLELPDKFKTKHLYKGGTAGAGVDSFSDLSSNPEIAKEYIVDLNRRLFKDNILPKLVKDPKNNGVPMLDELWMKGVTPPEPANPNWKPRVIASVMDTDAVTLKADVKAKFDAYVAQHGTDNLKDAHFETNNEYGVTELFFERDPADPNSFSLKATRKTVKVTVGVNVNGEVAHYQSPVDSGTQETKTLATFDAEHLTENARITDEFWKKAGVSKNNKNPVVNADHQNYKDALSELQQEWKDKVVSDIAAVSPPTGVCNKVAAGRRKRAAGRCAIYVTPDGKVDSIIPEEFVEAYKEASAKEKKALTDYVKNNGDKIIHEGETDLAEKRKKLNGIVHFEEVKGHVGTMGTVSQVQDEKRWRGTALEKPSEIIHSIHAEISSVHSNVKLSPSKVALRIANSKYARGIAHGVGIVGEPLGHFFLAKTIITGIIHGDTTSLAIVGGRLGYDVVTGSAVAAGTKLFSAASKMGKFAKILGKVAGPIGAGIDIGLSAWSLSKSVGRLNSATNKYDRDDAIADIVSDTVSIAVTAAVTVVSIAFPPAAPIAMAIGLVIDLVTQLATSIFHAANDVQRINSEVPLLDFEKEEVFTSRFFDWFGTREEDYIDELVKDKKANDLAVEHNLEFLRENPAFRGIVFPSRTLSYDGGCRLTKQFCKCDLGIFGCGGWEEEETWGEGCDWGKACGPEICTSHRGSDSPIGICGYNQFECKCERNAETEFGLPRRDSNVDFSEKRSVYWERAVPKDVEDAEFICKPGSTYFEDYKISQEYPRQDEYLCENAIGILQPSNKRTDEQVMLFDLQEGTDRITLSQHDDTSNIFLVGSDGEKYFSGSAGRNEFIFDGDCKSSLRGTLTGGDGINDAISIPSNCSIGQTFKLDFTKGYLASNSVDMRMSSIEEVTGRPNESEDVVASCNTHKVMLRGGGVDARDYITIPGDNCAYNLTMLLDKYTSLDSQAKYGNITVIVGEDWTDSQADLNIYPENNPKLNFIFTSKRSSDVLVTTIRNEGSILEHQISNLDSSNKMAIKTTFHVDSKTPAEMTLLFNETDLYSALIISPGNTPLFYHNLPEMDKPNSELRRVGCKNTGNYFEINGSRWHVEGGDAADEFVLKTEESLSIVDGGAGEDTLRLVKDIKNQVTIDLTLDGNFRNIENIYGSPEAPVGVTCGCDTKLVYTTGADRTTPDVIGVPNGQCLTKRNLQIVTGGNSRVIVATDLGEAETIGVFVQGSDVKQGRLQRFELDASQSEKFAGLVLAVEVNHKDWTFVCSNNTEQLLVDLNGNKGETIKLRFKDIPTETPYLGIPNVQLAKKDSGEPAAQLLLERETLQPKIYYDLTDNNETTSVTGYNGITNMFRIVDGSWNVVGGNLENVFLLTTTSNIVSIDGGNGKRNTLILEESSSDGKATFSVNLQTEQLGFLNSTKKGRIKSIHHVVGRSEKPDMVHSSCETNTIDGKGGLDNNHLDLVFVSENDCGKGEGPESLYVEVGKYTKVRNFAKTGNYEYLVRDPITSSLFLFPSHENQHLVRFEKTVENSIDEVKFDMAKKLLTLNFSSEFSVSKRHTFQMFRSLSISEEYINPTIQFQQPGQPSVTSDLRIGKDGVVAATFMVHNEGLEPSDKVVGLPVDVNVFLVNVTSTDRPGGVLLGSSKTKSNQFWIFNLKSILQQVDGGDCINCSNALSLGDTFALGKPIHVNLEDENSYVKSENTEMISNIRNIYELRGRTGASEEDSVRVMLCHTRVISEFERISIAYNTKKPCSFKNLIIGVDDSTTVYFDNTLLDDMIEYQINSTFHYRFSTLRSFDLDGNKTSLIGPTHIYYLNFTLDDVESMRFDLGDETIHYTISGMEYSHSMIGGTVIDDQFYEQPVMITQDNFRIQVDRNGGILLSLGVGSSFLQDYVRYSVVPAFEQTARRLGVTMIVQSDTQYFHVGYSRRSKVENEEGTNPDVLQNVGYAESHLLSGGAEDTIYEIVSLEKDVYVYPEFSTIENDVTDIDLNGATQVIDLTDIIVPLRIASKTKYVPQVKAQDGDLVVVFEDYEDKYPGKIYIMNGNQEKPSDFSLQILLSSAAMKLEKISGSWKIVPLPIEIPEGFVYSVAAEDLEDGQQIITAMLNESEEVKASFSYSRNETDLILSDVTEFAGHEHDKKQIELTTVIVTDFYLDTAAGSTEVDEKDTFISYPSQVLDVMVSLPGLRLRLNGKEVTVLEDQMTKEVIPKTRLQLLNLLPPPSSIFQNVSLPAKRLSFLQVPEWKGIIQKVEQEILKVIPDVQENIVY